MDQLQQRFDFARLAPWLVIALVLLAQLPLVLNPGYFSHDELQWAYYAQVAGMPGPGWWAFEAFQYRPLTFHLWMALSRALFDTPIAFHALLVAWGALNAALLAQLARRLGVATEAACVGALVFALGPYASYVHGWVGTLGDLLWVGCALLAALAALRAPRAWMGCAAAALLTAIGLLGKEAAVSIPALFGVACMLDPRHRRWWPALLGAAGVTVPYLLLRVPVLLHAPPGADQYAVSLAHVPRRWLEYQLFPAMPTVFETFSTLARGITARVLLAGVLWLAVLAATWRAQARLGWLFLLGGAAALGPVLLLGASWNHYGYAFAAVTAGCAAAAWTRTARWGRGVLALAALACTWHGVNVMRTLHHVGELQARFSPALARAVEAAPAGTVVRLAPAAEADAWVFLRLAHDLPGYRGVPLSGRVRLVDVAAPADFVIRADGSLQPVPR